MQEVDLEPKTGYTRKPPQVIEIIQRIFCMRYNHAGVAGFQTSFERIAPGPAAGAWQGSYRNEAHGPRRIP
eukprot:6184234-Pleurochrysis_carterae.AAC.1